MISHKFKAGNIQGSTYNTSLEHLIYIDMPVTLEQSKANKRLDRRITGAQVIHAATTVRKLSLTSNLGIPPEWPRG